jgi:hypothetical protein
MTDAEFDTYNANLSELSDEIRRSHSSAHELLEQHLAAGDARAAQLVSFREKLIAGTDRERVAGLLPTGLFRSCPTNLRVAAILVSLELAAAADLSDLQNRFERYRPDLPLFQQDATLLSHVRDGELIEYQALQAVRTDGIVSTPQGFGRLDPLLPASLVQTMAAEYRGKPLFVRLDPQAAWQHRPAQILMETTLAPANPRWWRTLALRRGATTGGSYRLDPPTSPSDNLEAYWEYHAKGLTRLETIAQRKKEDHLTFMLEELQQVRDGLLVGRCIHLDTSASAGTTPDEAEVLHVDLAINVYNGSKVRERLGAQLNKTDKVDASFRTHVLRAEGVPFEVAALLSLLFFESRALLLELFSNQFQQGSS